MRDESVKHPGAVSPGDTIAPPMSETPGLRRKKKLRTHDTIVRVARALFSERGFQATTIADIAAGADIAVSTLFGYFATKDDILFSDFPGLIADMETWFAERTGTRPALDLVQEYATKRVPAYFSDDRDWPVKMRSIIDADPYLQAQERMRNVGYERSIAVAVAADLGVGLDDPRPRLVAAATMGAFTGASWHAPGADPGDEARAAAEIEYVMAFARAGMEAIRVLPQPGL